MSLTSCTFLLLLQSLSRQSITHPSCSNHNMPYDFPNASIPSQHADDDDGDESDHSFVPNDSELESFSDESSDEKEFDMIESQETKPELKTPVNRRQSKGTTSKGNSSLTRRTRSRLKGLVFEKVASEVSSAN